jgi:hypothetical protein
VIAKEPVAGLAKTRLVPALGEAGAARMAGVMLAHTLAAVRATGADPWLCLTPAEARERLGRLAPGFGLLAQGPATSATAQPPAWPTCWRRAPIE